MFLTLAPFILLAALLSSSLADSIPAEVHDGATYIASCNRDRLYRSFIDSRYSSSASTFCSDFVRSTVSATQTITETTTVTAPLTKRGLPATAAFPASRLRSACSCLLRFTQVPTTVYASTKSITQTATRTGATPSCIDAKKIVRNGDFRTGSLAPWAVLFSAPKLEYYAQQFSYNVTSPGYNSKYAFTMTDELATTYVAVEIGQNVSVCPGRRYKLSAQVFITDGFNTPMKEQYAELGVDDVVVASAPESYIEGPPIVWKPLDGLFTAKATTAVLKVTLAATNFLAAQWGVDNVVVTPV